MISFSGSELDNRIQRIRRAQMYWFDEYYNGKIIFMWYGNWWICIRYILSDGDQMRKYAAIRVTFASCKYYVDNTKSTLSKIRILLFCVLTIILVHWFCLFRYVFFSSICDVSQNSCNL